ncbi:MAG: hypothetical protein ACHQ1F_01560 [Spirochaetia bacterium]
MIALLCLSAAHLHAQYGLVLHSAVSEDRLSVGASIRLLGVAAGSLRPEIGPEEARATLTRLGIRLPRDPDDSPITFGNFTFLLCQLFDVRGGVMYGMFPGPRSAFNELLARGLLPVNARPGSMISGSDAVLVLRRFLLLQGESRQ